MPLNRRNTKTFHRVLYSTILEKIRLHKRGDDQKQGTKTTYIIYQCRRGPIQKTGETIDGDMLVNHTVSWFIPIVELNRVGIRYLNPADKIEQLDGPEKGTFWQPESDTDFDVKLFGNFLKIDCKRLPTYQGF